MTADVTYSDLANAIARKYVEREAQIMAMQQVASALCAEAAKQLAIPEGRCRIGAVNDRGQFTPYEWAMGGDGSMLFAIQVDYTRGSNVIAQHYASFIATTQDGNVHLKCRETGGGALVPYAPQIQDTHLRVAAKLVPQALQVAAEKYRG